MEKNKDKILLNKEFNAINFLKEFTFKPVLDKSISNNNNNLPSQIKIKFENIFKEKA